MSPRQKTSNSPAEQELAKAAEQFDKFDEQVKTLTLDRMNEAPKKELEPQTKLASSEIEKSKDIYLKPTRSISSQEKFNEKFRSDYNFQKEYVQFIAENNEIIGENIEIWTKPFPGMPVEFWSVPTNKPIWGPRYLAENIKSRCYHRLRTENANTGADHNGQYYGTLVVDHTIQRLDARPVSSKKSVFMGAVGF